MSVSHNDTEGMGAPPPQHSLPLLGTPDLIGICALQTRKACSPAKAGAQMALPRVDPGFRRGTVTCPKGIIAKQVQGDEQREPCAAFHLVAFAFCACGIIPPAGALPS